MKVYHQQGTLLNQSDQNNDFNFGENNNYLQTGNAYLQFEITVRKDDNTIFHYDDPICLVNNAFAVCFKEARLSTTIDSDIEQNNFCGQVCTIIKLITNKNGDLLSQFDNIDASDIPILERLADLPPHIRSTQDQKR